MDHKVAFFHSCMMSDQLKDSITQQTWFESEVGFISMNSTVEEYAKYPISRDIIVSLFTHDEQQRVRMYNSEIGVIVSMDSCSSVVAADMLGCSTLGGFYAELFECHRHCIPCVIE